MLIHLPFNSIMYLYNSYCYSDINAAADSLYSSAVINGIGIIQSYNVLNLDTVQYSVLAVNPINSKSFNFVFSYTFKTCSQLGFDNTYFGLTNQDIITISWQVVLCMTIAWGFKQIRQMIK
jgi:hypothetical protein